MADFLISALPYLIAVSASYAGYYITGFLKDKWSKRRL